MRIPRLAAVLALVASICLAREAAALDTIQYEELKEQAIEYGKISQRFETCNVKPPASIRVAFLKYARAKGASDKHLEVLTEYFDEGRGRVRHLQQGFSPEECKQKLESPEGQQLLKRIEKWYEHDGAKGS
jgi:hypothetical protein